MYQRSQVATIRERMGEFDNPLMQVVVGPRQTGKSTMLGQALASHTQVPQLSVSSDDPVAPSIDWLETEWQQARNMTGRGAHPVLLVIDEIQKVKGWPHTVKALWDADRRQNIPVKVFLSGSSSLLLHKGLEDSLMGRFEIIRSPHWSYCECRDAFGFDLDTYLYFGGYPGAARFVHDETRWGMYIRDAVIEPTIARDVLELEDVRKPALMRSLFRLGALYSAQELSYNKMVGQLQDAGNTTTIAHYLELLDKAGMITALPKYHAKELERRRSSPRLMVYDTSLMTALAGRRRAQVFEDHAMRGHLVESAVGAYLLARAPSEGFSVSWWREGDDEVDFVLERGDDIAAIEVKSGAEKRQRGMTTFLKRFPHAKRIVVGGAAAGACELEAFLLGDIELFW